jgi:ribosomal-protein-alanine N-acetyltransferase
MIRRATAADVAFVASVERAIFGSDAWSHTSVEEELTGPHRHAWVAEDAGYVVVLSSDDVVDLQRIAVTPEHRRRGLAHDLLDTARAAVPGRMLLEVSASNAGGLAFYAAEGFVEIGRRRRYYRDGSDAIVMEAA